MPSPFGRRPAVRCPLASATAPGWELSRILASPNCVTLANNQCRFSLSGLLASICSLRFIKYGPEPKHLNLSLRQRAFLECMCNRHMCSLRSGGKSEGGRPQPIAADIRLCMYFCLSSYVQGTQKGVSQPLLEVICNDVGLSPHFQRPETAHPVQIHAKPGPSRPPGTIQDFLWNLHTLLHANAGRKLVGPGKRAIGSSSCFTWVYHPQELMSHLLTFLTRASETGDTKKTANCDVPPFAGENVHPSIPARSLSER